MTPERVPFANLAREVGGLRAELDEAIGAVLSRGWFVLGEEGDAFEREFADWLGSKHVVGVASGTDAIELALRALELEPGAEVITQANTCVPTIAGIERAGATPVLCDVEPAAGTMDPDSVVQAITERTAAIVPVHLYGQCGDMDAVREIAAEHEVVIIEDCAQAHGAEFKGRRAGTIGAMGCFSFYPTKNLGALGDAGAVVTGDDQLAARVRLVRQYGQTGRYSHQVAGVNSRMDEVQAAVLRVKLSQINRRNARRREIAAIYSDALAGTSASPLATLPNRSHAYHLYVTEVLERDRFQATMDEHGVATLVHYPVPVHRHPPYRQLAGDVALTVSEKLARKIVSLPIYPDLTDEEVTQVADAAVRSLRLANA